MWEFNEATGEVTLTGLGAYLGLPKAVNAGELPNVDVPESVTYSIMMAGNMMTVIIEAGAGVFWTFELTKEVQNREVLCLEYEYISIADLFEIFGPVLTTITFRTPEEAVEIANNTEYGLSAGIWSEKGSKILWTADNLDAGVIWSNTFNKFDPSSPFGGYKESGFGREGGRHGLLSYLKVRS